MELKVRRYSFNRRGKISVRHTIEIPAAAMEFLGWKEGKIAVKFNGRQKTMTLRQNDSLLEGVEKNEK